MPQTDVYGRVHLLDAAGIEAIAARLEARRQHARYIAMLHDYLDEVVLSSVREVLALGCGTGAEVRELVGRADFEGRVTAVDISPDLVEQGRRLASEEGVGDRIVWQVGDATRLELADDAFDLVLEHTLVSHVDDPWRVLQEAVRVTRPGGTLAVFDGDYATLTFATEDPAYGRDMDARIVQAIIANPWVLRSMPRLFRRLGLDLLAHKGWAFFEAGRADFFEASLRSYPLLLPRAGVATPEEAQAFVAAQLRASEDGTFFAGYNFHAFLGRKRA